MSYDEEEKGSRSKNIVGEPSMFDQSLTKYHMVPGGELKNF